ncbi:MAG: hypothetical protein ACOVOL_06010 [Bacteroidia bacterium]
MKNYSFLSLTLSFLLFFSCSKEKQLAKRMNGDWNIDLLEYKTNLTDTTSGAVIPVTGSSVNAGSVNFNSTEKTGGYSIDASTKAINLTLPGFPNPIIVPSTRITASGSGTFSNTENSITIIDGQRAPKVFKVISSEKTTMLLETDETTRVDSLNLNLVINLSLHLSKK